MVAKAVAVVSPVQKFYNALDEFREVIENRIRQLDDLESLSDTLADLSFQVENLDEDLVS